MEVQTIHNQSRMSSKGWCPRGPNALLNHLLNDIYIRECYVHLSTKDDACACCYVTLHRIAVRYTIQYHTLRLYSAGNLL